MKIIEIDGPYVHDANRLNGIYRFSEDKLNIWEWRNGIGSCMPRTLVEELNKLDGRVRSLEAQLETTLGPTGPTGPPGDYLFNEMTRSLPSVVPMQTKVDSGVLGSLKNSGFEVFEIIEMQKAGLL